MTSQAPAAASKRRRIVGVSTKMYFSAARTTSYVASFLDLLARSPHTQLASQLDIFIIPDFVTLTTAIAQVQSARPQVGHVLVGAQDCYSADTGPFTGEVSPAVLTEVGARIIELGHAERRRLFGETDASTAAKATAAARNGMIPLVCIGERSHGGVVAAVDEVMVQVVSVLAAVPDDAEIVLAYEPVWAIGAAEPAGHEHVVAVVNAIREQECVRGRTGLVRILYGGSAGPGLFDKLKGAVDGLFLGRFAHDPEQFYKTVCEIASA